jgi:hypothetical protein
VSKHPDPFIRGLDVAKWIVRREMAITWSRRLDEGDMTGAELARLTGEALCEAIEAKIREHIAREESET